MSSSEQHTPEERRMEAISGLRALADFLEEHEDMRAHPSTGSLTLVEYPGSEDALVARMAVLGGAWHVQHVSAHQAVRFVRRFGACAEYVLYIDARKVGNELDVTRTIVTPEYTLHDRVRAAAAGEQRSVEEQQCAAVSSAVDRVMGGAA